MIAKRLLWLSISIIVIGGGLLIWHYFDPNFSLFSGESNLKDTMKEIQDGLNNAGTVSYVLKYHNGTTGEDRSMSYKVETSKVSADPNTCFLIYEQRTYLGAAHRDTGSVVQLRGVKRIFVRTMEQEVNSSGIFTDHPEVSVKSSPPVFVVEPVQPDTNEKIAFFFLNDAQANKMAKALIHAAELCGGGK
jgi:hypothetical protein